MGIGSIHTAGPWVFTHATSGSFNLDTVNDHAVTPDVVERITHAAGRHLPSHIHVASAMPMLSLTTMDLSTALANIDANCGLAIDGGGSGFTTLDCYLTKMQNLGCRASGSVNFRTRLVYGLVILGTLTMEQGADATLTLEVHAIYDGTNAPFVYSENNALPHVASVDEKFTLGPVAINGTVLDGVQRVTITFSKTVTKESGGGELYPTFGGVSQTGPSIEIVTKEVPAISDFGLLGTAQGATDTTLYARKYEKNGNHLADATAEHIKFTLDDGMVIPRGASGSNNTSADANLTIRPIYDGTNNPIVITAASAIT